MSTWMSALLTFFSIGVVSTVSQSQDDAARPSSDSSAAIDASGRTEDRLTGPRLVSAAIADFYSPWPTEAVGPLSYPPGLNPLTGLPYPSEEAKLRRNLIVKVSNWPPRVRPQHGINQADLVYEMESEGGVTRFAAIFRSNAPERVGSVRSARLVDMELLNMYAALLAYSGTSGPVRELYKARVNRFVLLSPSLGDNCETAGFCRDETLLDRGYEHTLFGDTRQMWQSATWRDVNIGFRANGFAFDLQADAGGQPIRDIYINWYNRTDVRWQYDEASRRYLRFSDGLPHFDAADEMQLWADNLVMLQVAHNRRPDLFEPGAINESFEVALWGQGRALVMREGQLYKGYWRRRDHNRGAAISLIYGDEAPIMLKPGRTWVTVMRSLDSVEPSETRQDTSATVISGAQS
ncbi:MAG: DUF3048 domain-containing protein [Chloroflexota bacterium]|nr:DUF3048 domain-containing protein [Chloroflexota bacterium]